MLYSLIAFHLLGLNARVDEIVHELRRLERLREGMQEVPLDALLARDRYPDVIALCSIEKWTWNSMKDQVRREYQEQLRLKAEADSWNLPSRHDIITHS